eukprot:GHVS01084735.1.p1 GENE.GHVS01084735.1~~GHVS01084735.1.p1  ORF type:complete len:517 (+),score=84.40 GHVS01084735.1:207-1757(+)
MITQPPSRSNTLELPRSSTAILPEGVASLESGLSPSSSWQWHRDYTGYSEASTMASKDYAKASYEGLTPSTTTSSGGGDVTGRSRAGFGIFADSGGGGDMGATEETKHKFHRITYKVAVVFILLLFITCVVLLRYGPSQPRLRLSGVGGIDVVDRTAVPPLPLVRPDGCMSGDGSKGCDESVLEGVKDVGEGGRKSLRQGLKLYEWSSATQQEIKSHRIKIFMLLFYDFSAARESSSTKEEKEHMEEMREVLHKSAVQFSSQDILHIGVPLENLHDFQFFLGDEPERDVPFAMLVEVKNSWKKYRLDNPATPAITDTDTIQTLSPPMATLTSDQLVAFEQGYFSGSLSTWLRSEVPLEGSVASVVPLGRNTRAMTRPGVVQQIVGSQFQMNVMETKVDTLVFFFAPWCGHCKSFEGGFEKLAKKFKDIRSIDFIKMDAIRNDVSHPFIHIERVPYVRFFKTEAKRSDDQPIVFSHAEKDVVKYGTELLQQHSTCPFDLWQGLDNCNLSRGSTEVEL